MCLSTVIRDNCPGKEILCKNIQKAEVAGSRLIFTDIMGIRTEIEAEISTVDLVDNIIHIKV